MQITFLGAAKTVTGSCYLVQTDKHKFLVDAGLFQGLDVVARNTQPLSYNPKELDFILLTHAHMDHSGMLPRVVKEGFKGRIYMTPPTSALSEILLMDAAKIQEGNLRRNLHPYSESMPYTIEVALYTTVDAIDTINLFQSVSFNQPTDINGLKVTFIPAGHILGAASIYIEYQGESVLFSGDIGRNQESQSVVPSFDKEGLSRANPDYVIMESLYGGITHPDRDQTLSEFLNLIIPSFAVQRTQELLELLKFSFLDNKIPKDVQVFLDTPLGLAATKIYTSNSHYFNDKLQFMGNTWNFREIAGDNQQTHTFSQQSRFDFENLRIVRFHKQSLALGRQRKAVILAGSGMAEGGRILNHLAMNIADHNNTVMFVGYQADGTLGRKIVDGNKVIKINNKKFDVRARIEYLQGFSAHADQPTLIEWLGAAKKDKLKNVFLVHADPDRSEAFKSAISNNGYEVTIPDWKQNFQI